jgi:hypothetical protein
MKPAGQRAGDGERQSIEGLHNGRMAGMRIDSCASSGPKKPQCDSNSLLGLGRDAGPDRLTCGGDHTFFWGGGNGRDPALDWKKSHSSDARVWRPFRASSHRVGYGRSAVSISSRANGALGEHRQAAPLRP